MEKKITLSLRRCLLLAGSMALVSSCQDYEPFSEDTVKNVAYTREFVKEFGEIDPNQNWDLFGQLGLGYRGRPIITRAVPSDVTVENLGYSVVIKQNEINAYENVLPEDGGSAAAHMWAAALPYNLTNLGRVTQDFVMTASEFTITQLNYNTSGRNQIGIYWYIDQDEYDHNRQEGDITITGQDGKTYYIRRKPIYRNKTNVSGWNVTRTYEEVHLDANVFDNELHASYPERYDYADQITRYDENHNVLPPTMEDYWHNTIRTRIFNTGHTGTYNGETYEIWATYGELWYNNTYQAHDIVKEDLCTLHSNYILSDGTLQGPNYNGTQTITYNAGDIVKVTETSQPIYTNESSGNPVINEGDRSFYQMAQSYFNHGANELHSLPIHVEIPADIPYYGFYIYNSVLWEGETGDLTPVPGTRYSEANLNPKVTFPNESEPRETHFVCTFSPSDINIVDANGNPIQIDDTNRYLCFEDWMGNATNFDLNDLVFILTVEPNTIVDHTEAKEEALLVCEDLANFDFDFNDDVLKLSYKDGVTRTLKMIGDEVVSVEIRNDIPILTITAMAAGGAFESTVYINGQQWDEIHKLLGETGYSGDAHGHTPRNIDAKFSGNGRSMELRGFLGDNDNPGPLPPKNVVSDGGTYPTYLSQLFDTEGFFRIVCDGGIDAQQIIENKRAYKDKENTSDVTQLAPQMMLLPIYFEWPQELVPIREAYEDFSDWVSDINETHWIVSSQIEKNITDRGDLWTEAIQGISLGVQEMFISTDEEFTYTDKNGISTTYTHCSKINFLASIPISLEQQDYGKLTVTYSTKPNVPVYLDFADGSQLIEDNSSSTVVTYHLSKKQVQKAMSTGAIYIMAQGNAIVEISSAELELFM